MDAVDITDDYNFANALESHVAVNISEMVSSGSFATKRVGKGTIDPVQLAKRWGVSPEKAESTIKRTSQQSIKKNTSSDLVQRRRTNARAFRYFHFNHDVFTDTMFAGTTSKRGNTAAQVFATSFGWSRAYPLKSKKCAHEALSDFLKTEGIPPNVIMDGSKEQLLGNFKRKLREVGTHPRQTEPYSPWQNAAERDRLKKARNGPPAK
jgi:hypothetical protein